MRIVAPPPSDESTSIASSRVAGVPLGAGATAGASGVPGLFAETDAVTAGAAGAAGVAGGTRGAAGADDAGSGDVAGVAGGGGAAGGGGTGSKASRGLAGSLATSLARGSGGRRRGVGGKPAAGTRGS